jgi:hypothetical protein
MQLFRLSDIWDSLLESEEGHVLISKISITTANRIKSGLSKHKHLEFRNNPALAEIYGEFTLAYEIDEAGLHIRRVHEKKQAQRFKGEVTIL